MPVLLRNMTLVGLLSFGLVAGFYGRYLPGLVCLTLIGIILFLSIGGARRWVAQVVARAMHRAWPLIVGFGRWLRGWGARGGVAAGGLAARGARAGWGSFVTHPVPWLAFISLVTTLFLFWNGWYHLGAAALLATLSLFIACFDGWWGGVGRTAWGHLPGTWVAVSLVALVVTGGHTYFLGGLEWWGAFVLSAISLVLAAIVAAGWGGWLWDHALGALFECLGWMRGFGAFLISWAIVLGVVTVVYHVRGGDAEFAKLLYIGYILAIFAGMGAAMLYPVYEAKRRGG